MRFALLMAFAAVLAAQDPRFDVESRLVLVPATVTDRRGSPIVDLEPSDFMVLDNGRPQKAIVDTFATGVAPIALVVAVQSSGISAAVLAKTRKIGAMIQPLITGQRGCAALVSFAEQVHWLQDCTSDPDELSRAFFQLREGDEKSGRMIDAVNEAIERLGRRPNVRRVLLLISESRDRGSATDLQAAVVAAQTAGVTVYAATYSAFKTAFTAKPSDIHPPKQKDMAPLPTKDPESPPGRERVPIPPPSQRVDLLGAIGELSRLSKVKTTEVLAAWTGGAEFPFTRQKGLEDVIQKLSAELHAQYVLSFTPDAQTAGYHDLEVRIKRAGDFRIRARPGYWSVQK